MLRKEGRNDSLTQCYKNIFTLEDRGALDPPTQFPLTTLSRPTPKPAPLKFYYILGAFVIVQHKFHEPCSLQHFFQLIFNVWFELNSIFPKKKNYCFSIAWTCLALPSVTNKSAKKMTIFIKKLWDHIANPLLKF
jgi:hypothetical protein